MTVKADIARLYLFDPIRKYMKYTDIGTVKEDSLTAFSTLTKAWKDFDYLLQSGTHYNDFVKGQPVEVKIKAAKASFLKLKKEISEAGRFDWIRDSIYQEKIKNSWVLLLKSMKDLAMKMQKEKPAGDMLIPILIVGGGLGVLIAMQRKRRGLTGFGNLAMSDEAHGKEVIRFAEEANENLTEVEESLKARRSKKACMTAFNKLRAAYTPIIAAKEQASSVESGKAKYDELVNNMATDYTNLQEQLTKRCGRLDRSFKYKWGRKCIQWYKRKKKGRRICKKYKKVRRR